MSTWLLVHPPLLGPAVLGPLAAELRSRGHAVAVPDLRGALDRTAGWWDRYTALAAAAGPAEVVLGFSGAGVVLPAVAAAVGAQRVVWLDALMPAVSGATTTPADRRAALARLVRDGRIAAWPTWWTPEQLAAELPDEALRTAVGAEAVALPADFYDVAVPVPDRWPDHDVRYVHLSASYDGDAAQARARGWQVVGDGTGAHLDVTAHPARISAMIDRPARTAPNR